MQYILNILLVFVFKSRKPSLSQIFGWSLKKVAVVTTVKGAGGNAQKAFEILSMQLSNYNLQVFEKFHLITKSDHQNEKSILDNEDVIKSLNNYVEEFLNI